MKRIILFFICLIATVPSFAQRDIKTLDKIGLDAIVAILGPHDGEDGMYDDEVIVHFANGDTQVRLNISTSELLGFNTKSSAFCVLSDYIAGGFKVGDSLTKLQGFDFVHSTYGKNRSGNALTLIDSTAERDYYKAYGMERRVFEFIVKNGIITKIIFRTMDDDTAAALNVDKNNHPWR